MSALAYGSVCSGIEAATVAWHPLGWRPQFFSEVAAAPRAVLAHHYPEVPCHGDFTTIQAGDFGAIDLLVGGTPCQSFSLAGLRGGLADDRGNLALQFLRLADRLRPRWLVWENVPGVLSSNGGRDFGAILGGMVQLGYGFAYRVLDAQYIRIDGFGRAVPQRRRRVFVVGHLGGWRRSAAVLFERASLRGDLAPRREAQAGVAAGTLGGTSPGGGWRFGADEAAAGHLVAHSLRGEGFDASEDGTGRGTPIVPVAFGGNDTRGPIQVATTLIAHGGPCGRMDFESETFIAFSCKDYGADATDGGATPTLRAMGHSGSHANAGGQMAVAFNWQGGGTQTSLGFDPASGITGTLAADQTPAIAQGWAVRRLTPLECERLQGFPDGYTLVPHGRGMMADGPRYKAPGNSMACNVMRWIGRRIEMVEADGFGRVAA